MAFRGTFDYTLDAKNRLTVPAKFRAALADGVLLAKNLYDPCVDLWRPRAYEEFTAASLSSFNPMSRDVRRLRRFFSSSSLETELDSAGRVMLAPFLLAHAGLGKEVVVVGADDHLEIWDRAGWQEQDAALSHDIPDIAASLGHPD